MTHVGPELRRVAQRLLLHESVGGGKSASRQETAAFRVCEKLRLGLSVVVGAGGFRALLDRALSLAKAEAPELAAVQVGADGSLAGLGKVELRSTQNQIAKGESILIAHLLALLVAFIGKALLLSLLLDAWPKASFEDWKS
jgi:hypothetical protein